MVRGERKRDRRSFTTGCLLLLFLVGAMASGCLDTTPAPPGENVTPVAAGHPRLYFLAADVPVLRAKVENLEPYRSWFTDVRSLAARTRFPEGPSLSQGDLGDAARALRTNAFVYAVTGDQEYGLRARDYLLRACTWPSWQSADRLSGGQLLSYGSGAFHGAVGEAYDWIYPLLSEGDRATVRQAMVEKSLEAARQQNSTYVDRPDYCTNRIALAYGGVGVAALSLRGDLPGNTGVEPYAGLVHDVMTRRFFDCFDRDGGWSEGIGYLSFGLSEDAGGSGGIYYAEALRRATGEDLFRHENFSHVPEFIVYFLPPDRKGESSAFGDEAFSVAFHSAPAAALASRTGNPYGQWYYLNAPLERPDPIGEILFADLSLPAVPPDDLPLSRLFRDQGWVAMRTGWNLSDTLAGFMCGPRRPGHGRPERNSFMLDALGERLVITAGLSSLGYDDPDYMDYNYAAVGQNTILLNGDPKSQVDSPWTSCTITGLVTTPFFDRVQGDATAAYEGKLSKFTRDLILVKTGVPGFLVIRDDLATVTGTTTFDFLLHALGQESITLTNRGGGRAAITRGNATLHVAVILPAGAAMSVHPGSPTYFEGTDQPTSYLQVGTGKAAETRFLVVLYPVITGSPEPHIEGIQEGGTTGVSVTRGEATDLLLFAPSGAGISAAGVAGDGSMAWVHLEGGRPSSFALLQGTSLAYKGRSLYLSPVPATAADRIPAG